MRNYTWEEVQQYANERVAEEVRSRDERILELEAQLTSICSYVREVKTVTDRLKIVEQDENNRS